MTTQVSHSQPAVPADQVENIKDTIESLVIAFILAFVFRGFLVEAFVIPTGSMAPTLYGKHGTQLCPDCGWEFAYGLPDRHPERQEIKCPNCSWVSGDHIELPYHARGTACRKYREWFPSAAKRAVDPLTAERVAHLSFEPRTGDRILVFKWPFDLGGPLLRAQPWDVVVFKNPLNGEDNYIKRLIGIPNEVLEIIDGDIYTCPIDAVDEPTLKRLDEVVHLKYRLVHRLGDPRSLNDRIKRLQGTITRALDDKLQIRRKTEIAQSALWRVVFHQDYLPPKNLKRRPPRWETIDLEPEEAVWDARDPRVKFAGLDRDRQTIEFMGKSFSDFYAYNHSSPGGDRASIVGDLRMRFVLDYHGGEGTLGLSLSKQNDVFAVELSPDGQVSLRRSRMGERRSPQLLLRARMPAWDPDQPIEIEFGNVDYRLYLKINGQTEPLLETGPEDYTPDLAQVRRTASKMSRRPRARISADHLDIELYHLSLERDVHYKNSSPSTHLGWGTAGNPIYLREGEYFVLGDNSPASQDSRLWTTPGLYLLDREERYQVGTVPGDQLIGKAFFVYWPSGYRIKWLPVLKSFGAIPNAGKMRWIR